MNNDYQSFLAGKALKAPRRGLDAMPELAGHLFPFQRHCVEFLLRVGTGGLFLDTGLGKTECQLEWAHQALRVGNGRALILTPLAVARQTQRRAERWGYESRVVRQASDVGSGINICNYDRLDRLDPTAFGAVSLDEGSILKSFTGRLRNALVDAFRSTPWRLVATATPAPNDHMELGNYAEFLGIMAGNEMLSRFFINDTSTASQQWRLKGHAEIPFWDWMTSWARMAMLPSDLGDDDRDFILPPLNVHRHRARDSRIDDDLADLFGAPRLSATTLHDVKRQTATARAEMVAQIVDGSPGERWVLWCDTDYEAAALKAALPDAIEISGSQTIDEKEDRLEAFARGEVGRLLAKPSMCGFGLDWSHCCNTVFAGRSYSYEIYYQAVRRFWRFGQTRPVDVHLVIAEGETEIGRVVDAKAAEHQRMHRAMKAAWQRAGSSHVETKVAYRPDYLAEVPSWLTSAA